MEVVEFSPPVGPASGFFDLDLLGFGVGLVQGVEAGEAVGLENAVETLHEGPWMLALAIGAVEVDHRRRIGALIGPAIPHDHPHAAFLGLLQSGIEHRDDGVIAMQMGCRQRRLPDQLGDGSKLGNRRSCPANQGRARDVDAEPGEDLALSVQRKMIVEFRDQDVAQKASAGPASLDRGRGRRWLDDLFAQPAALLQPGDLQNLELGADIVEQFVDVLAKQTQLAAAIRAAITGIEHAAFSWQMGRQLLPAATTLWLVLFVVSLGLAAGFVVLFSLLGGAIGLKILEHQLQLIDLPLDLLR